MKTTMTQIGKKALTEAEAALVFAGTFLEEKFADYDLFRAGIVCKEHFIDDDEFFINARKISKSLAKSLRAEARKVWSRYSASGDYIAYAREWKSILASQYGISWNGEMGCLRGYCD